MGTSGFSVFTWSRIFSINSCKTYGVQDSSSQDMTHLESSGKLFMLTLSLKDMQFDEDNGLYFRDCRCGDQYNLPKEEIHDCDTELCLECDTCSNTITIITTNG